MNSTIGNAIAELKKGNFVILYDSDMREGECDLIIPAFAITPKHITHLRKEAGGSIVLAIGSEIAKELELPYLHDLFTNANIAYTYKKTNYGDTPPYTTPVNHVNAHTGVTDNDKALAIRSFAKIFKEKNRKKFLSENFKTPGHLPICVSKGIEDRKGHTELSVELAKQAGIDECMVLCEMLDDGIALSKEKARKYAEKNNIVFLAGEKLWKR